MAELPRPVDCVPEINKPGRPIGSINCDRCSRAKEAGKYRCDFCQERHRTSYRNNYRIRVLRGQCVCCTQKATAGAFCFTHWLKNIGHSYKLGKKNGGIALLQRIWDEQCGKCAVTGMLLIPGVSASLDHIIPLSKGGTSTKENMRWVLLEINRAKADMTHQQFVDMCLTVVKASFPIGIDGKVDYSLSMRSN